MRYRKLTSTGDYSFGNNNRDFIEGNEALAQAIKTRILLFYNEWWEDLESGIPMFQNIIGQINGDNIVLALQGVLTKRIQEFKEVKNIEFKQMDIDQKLRIVTMLINCSLNNGSEIGIEINI